MVRALFEISGTGTTESIQVTGRTSLVETTNGAVGTTVHLKNGWLPDGTDDPCGQAEEV